MRLADPLWLLLLVFVPLPWLAERARPRVRWPSLGLFPPRRWGSGWRRQISLVLRAAAIACLAVAMARPQEVAGRTRIAAQGVAIVVAIDQSGSMSTADFPGPDGPAIPRLDAAKSTLDRFIEGRPDDLIGLVTFATYPDLACPPTLDHDVLRSLVAAVEPARPGEVATNIGDAIVWSLRAVLEAPPERKVIVLLTDGRNQVDEARTPEAIDPVEAARLASRLGVRLHAVGIGEAGGPMRVAVPGTGLSYQAEERAGYDPLTLAAIAVEGGGGAFGAADAGTLDEVFRRIDALETSPIHGEIRTRYRETFAPWAAAALILMAVDRLGGLGRSRRLP